MTQDAYETMFMPQAAVLKDAGSVLVAAYHRGYGDSVWRISEVDDGTREPISG
jgi:hypothetical protein